jgi:hypothetical protein
MPSTVSFKAKTLPDHLKIYTHSSKVTAWRADNPRPSTAMEEGPYHDLAACTEVSKGIANAPTDWPH